MARFFRHSMPLWWRRGSSVFLALSWLSGFFFGSLIFYITGSSFSSLMRGVIYGSVSIVGLMSVSVLPFLISAFAVYISKPSLLLIVSFGKAFLFSFVSLGIMDGFASTGWLIRWLLMFSDLISLPVLYWFWNRHISGDIPFSAAESLLVLSLCILVGSVDYCYVSPFLANLINT